jgi:hypothetical protein
VDELKLSDPVARRVARFFTDLMVTLADDGADAVESADAISTLWSTRTSEAGPAGLELDAETLVHGLGAVAIALADELVAVRRAAGATCLTAVDVWAEVARALEPAQLPGTGEIDLT